MPATPSVLRIHLDVETTFNWFGRGLQEGELTVYDDEQWAQVTASWLPGDAVLLVAFDGSTLPGVIIGIDHADQRIEVLA